MYNITITVRRRIGNRYKTKYISGNYLYCLDNLNEYFTFVFKKYLLSSGLSKENQFSLIRDIQFNSDETKGKTILFTYKNKETFIPIFKETITHVKITNNNGKI